MDKDTNSFVHKSLILLNMLQVNAGVKPVATLEAYDRYRITDTTPIPKPDPIMMILGETIAVASDVFAISGAAKAGKSAFMNMAIAASLSYNGTINDGIEGLQMKPNKDSRAVIHIDTEQAEHKQQYNIRKIFERAGWKTCPAFFLSYNIRKLDLSEYQPKTTGICEASANEFNGIHSVWIDGGADFIAGVNDEETANAIIKYFEGLSITYNTAVFIVVHTNPGGDKERGHFGSQLQRKAGGILSVKEDIETNSNYIEPKMLRYAGKGDIPLLSFQFDKEKGYHVGVETLNKSTIKASQKVTELKALSSKVFTMSGIKYKVAIAGLMRETGQSKRTCDNKLNDMEAIGLVVKDENGYYRFQVDATVQN